MRLGSSGTRGGPTFSSSFCRFISFPVLPAANTSGSLEIKLSETPSYSVSFAPPHGISARFLSCRTAVALWTCAQAAWPCTSSRETWTCVVGDMATTIARFVQCVRIVTLELVSYSVLIVCGMCYVAGRNSLPARRAADLFKKRRAQRNTHRRRLPAEKEPGPLP